MTADPPSEHQIYIEDDELFRYMEENIHGFLIKYTKQKQENNKKAARVQSKNDKKGGNSKGK